MYIGVGGAPVEICQEPEGQASLWGECSRIGSLVNSEITVLNWHCMSSEYNHKFSFILQT